MDAQTKLQATPSSGGTGFGAILEELRKKSRNTVEQGRYFERLIKSVLKKHPGYDFENVWTWRGWPDRKRLTGQDGKDIGIDLVARGVDGDFCAIQCKFFDFDHALQKSEIDSFFTESGKEPFTSRLIVTTTDNWSANAEKALEGQQIDTHRLRFRDLKDLPFEWDTQNPARTRRKPKKKLFDHQKEAVKKVLKGFKSHPRGKMIMACGTGKTLTALHIAEKQVPDGGHVLFLVPSISLMSQTLHEWPWQRSRKHRYLAVCSDAQVDRQMEDVPVADLAISPTTDAYDIRQELKRKTSRTTVVFCTYHSLDRIHQAQQKGAPKFDLVICDEAHRTTGVDAPQRKESHFSKINKADYIKAKKRLYMTATPRIYTEVAKAKAESENFGLYSMDDEGIYGPEFYRLDFSEAVEKELLSDYRVVILNVAEEYISRTMQDVMSGKEGLNLGDVAKIVGCYKALRDQGKKKGGVFLKRAVMFANTIANSKKLKEAFKDVVDELDKNKNDGFTCETEHVDGTFSAPARSQLLDWLKEDAGSNEHGEIGRILSNARCLTEGVDVPALDSVIFMNPRNSQVDIVQAVGRVMRKDTGKKYGYIILPVVVPVTEEPEDALKSSDYNTVWSVLNALRSHDNRFDAMINQIDLNDKKPEQVIIGGEGFDEEEEGEGGGAGEGGAEDATPPIQWRFDFGDLENAILAKLVDKCGDRKYWEVWAKDVADIHNTIVQRITDLRAKKPQVKQTFGQFHTSIRANINDALTDYEATSMLAQHLITQPVFDALFAHYKFSKNNPVSQSMEKVLNVLKKQGLASELESMNRFYESVRGRAKDVDNAKGRQSVVIELYEKFFKTAFAKAAESLGIAYTPIEIVDFILKSADYALKKEFGRGLTDENVHIIDPFTGTGSFINRLIQNPKLIADKDLKRKFRNEIHANDILLLAYYIASVNIEEAYHDRMSKNGDTKYDIFPGIVLTDTFNLYERKGSSGDDLYMPENSARVTRQRNAPIRVVVGNPPWSKGQKSENDDNKNPDYPKLDRSIRTSYAKKSKSTGLISLYDSYIRAIRWASDRIGDEGIVAYVSNGGWLDGSSADGMRQCLAEEFDVIWVFNLRGNARLSGEAWRKEGDKIFGQASRAPVTITLLAKTPHNKRAIADIRYHDIGDYLSRKEKFDIITHAQSINGLDWQSVTPNKKNDWINQRDKLFQKFKALGSKEVKSGKCVQPDTIFRMFSNGLVTARDSWAYSFSTHKLTANMKGMIGFYNEQLDSFQKARKENGQLELEKFINQNPKNISWTRGLKAQLKNGHARTFVGSRIRKSLYRPFTHEWLYFDRYFNEVVYQMPSFFPSPDTENRVICVTGSGAEDAAILIANTVVDVNLFTPTQCFPRYYWSENGERHDNVTNSVLEEFRTYYGDNAITRDDIFDYVYGVLHAPDYQKRFAADLKKELPRVPFAPDFTAFRDAGRALAALHLNYDTAKEYPLSILVNGEAVLPDMLLEPKDYRVTKMSWGKTNKKEDRSRIKYNNRITLAGIPEEALDYTVSGRSALKWVIDRYQFKKDKYSGIVNDPNDWANEQGQADWLIHHIQRITHISVESARIIASLPPSMAP